MDFSQIKTGRPDTITLITDEVIKSITKVRLFEGREQANQANERLYEINKQLLRTAKNKNRSFEVGGLWNLMDDSVYWVRGKKNGIAFESNNIAYNLIRNGPCRSLVAIHNHPRNGMFSTTDIRTFAYRDSIYAMLAICNDGTIYTMYKLENFNRESFLYYYNSLDTGGTYSRIKTMAKNAGKLNIVYRCSVRRK